VERVPADRPRAQAEQSRKLRQEAEQVRAGLLFTLFALLEARACASQALEESRKLRLLGERQLSSSEMPRFRTIKPD
jgi:hypothetical protein